jgi:PPM family protein phosphatase
VTATVFRMGSFTSVGRVRALNEDAVIVDKQVGLAVVADGIGGAEAGEIASRIAVQTILEDLRRSLTPMRKDLQPAELVQILKDTLVQTNEKVCSAAESKLEWRGMGATAAVAVIQDACAAIARSYGGSRRETVL